MSFDWTSYDPEDDVYGESRFFFGKTTIPEAREFYPETHSSFGWKFSWETQRQGYASGLTYVAKDPAYELALPAEPGDEYVYFVHAPEVGRVKVGWSTNVGNRLASMQTGSPCELRLVKLIRGGKDLEQKIHVRFRDLRLDGEWFSDEILAEWAKDPL